MASVLSYVHILRVYIYVLGVVLEYTPSVTLYDYDSTVPADVAYV